MVWLFLPTSSSTSFAALATAAAPTSENATTAISHAWRRRAVGGWGGLLISIVFVNESAWRYDAPYPAAFDIASRPYIPSREEALVRRILVGIALVALAACGNGTKEADSLAGTTTAPAATPKCDDGTPTAPPKEDEVGETKPDVEVPEGDPPCELIMQDIHEGSGAEAKEGATVTVHYVGVSWSTGEQFDASWDNGGEPIPLSLGQVIVGWQQGIPGMKEGGRRRLIIPPELAYGATPPTGSGIAVNETLIFVIDLVKAG